MTDQERIAGWKHDSEQIGVDMNTVWTQWFHAKALVTAIDRSPQARDHPEAFYLYVFVFKAVVDQIVLGIRRQLDKNTATHSFLNLLRDLHQNPGTYTLDECIKSFLERADRMGMTGSRRARYEMDARIVYSNLSDASGNSLDPVKIQDDIDNLLSMGKRAKAVADQHIAHNDRKKPEYDLGVNDLDAAVLGVKRLMRKYGMLFDGGGAGEGEPDLGQMLSLYRFAWLED